MKNNKSTQNTSHRRNKYTKHTSHKNEQQQKVQYGKNKLDNWHGDASYRIGRLGGMTEHSLMVIINFDLIFLNNLI